jgi:shikimate kinase
VTIYLMGLRGSGKTTLGPMLAARVGGAFVDLDAITPAVLGVASAAEALRRFGTPAFREAERHALGDPRVLAAAVVGLGGGTPTHPPSEAELRRRASAGDRLIYLRAAPATLRARLAATDLTARPSLTGAGVLNEIETLFAVRDPIYRSLSSAIVEVDDAAEAECVERLVRAAGA